MESEAWEQPNETAPSYMNQDGDGDRLHGEYGGQNGSGVASEQQDEQRAAGARQGGETEQHRKLFIGGLSFKTEEESLKTFFSQYGEVVDCVVMRDGTTKRPRGFGFITYATVTQVDEAQKHRPHVIDGKTVETKRAMPKEESERPDSHVTTKRMWVGGVAESCTEADLRNHFSQYGGVQSVELVADKTGRPRGFAFVNFDDYDAVDKAILAKPHLVGNTGRPLEVRKALSRAEMDQVRAGRGGLSGGGRGGRRGGSGAGLYGPPAGPYGYPAYGGGGGSYGYYGPKRGSGRGRGSSYGGGAGGSGGGSAYGSYSGYAPYGAYSDYGGYEYGGHGGHGWSGESAGRGGNWPGDGASFGAGYSQYDAGGPMRGSSQYSQRSAGPYGGYSGGYGGGYGAGGRH